MDIHIRLTRDDSRPEVRFSYELRLLGRVIKPSCAPGMPDPTYYSINEALAAAYRDLAPLYEQFSKEETEHPTIGIDLKPHPTRKATTGELILRALALVVENTLARTPEITELLEGIEDKVEELESERG